MSVHLKYSKLSISFWFTCFLHRVENMHASKTHELQKYGDPQGGKKEQERKDEA